ncbi:MAG: hypothetical protein ACP5HS_10595 [Anaerolineae bacterium]
MGPNAPLPLDPMAFNWLWGYFMPIGLLLLIWGGLSPEKARRVTPIAATAVALTVLGYWAIGFALHMGGAYPVTQDPALEGLNRMFPIVPGDPGWGISGLSGFFLSGQTANSRVFDLFLAYLPLMASAVLLVTLALAQTRRWIMVTAGLLAATVVVPVAACWMWGSGWLAHLGETLGLGHGFVDFGGSTLILWLPGMMVVPILLLQHREPPSTPPEPPETYAPLMANVGALLLGIGWLGWELSGPFHASGAVLDWQHIAINVLLGMAGATVTSQLYAWLMLGKPEALLASQGLTAGWGAVLASAAFVPYWAALSIGLLAGLLLPLVHYGVRVWLRIQDAAGAVALAFVSGPLGLLSIGILANGQWGQGWNRMGLSPDGSVSGPGVSGLFVSGGAQQLVAQVTALVSIGAWGLLWGGILGLIASPRLLGRWSPRRALRGKTEEPTLVAVEEGAQAPETSATEAVAASTKVELPPTDTELDSSKDADWSRDDLNDEGSPTEDEA